MGVLQSCPEAYTLFYLINAYSIYSCSTYLRHVLGCVLLAVCKLWEAASLLLTACLVLPLRLGV